MRRKLLRLLLPASVVAAATSLAGMTHWLKWLPGEAMPIAWLLVVAVVLGAIAWGLAWVLPRGHRKWSVPFAVAAVVQVVGVVLYGVGSWPDWSDPVWTTGIVLLLGIVVVVTWAVVEWLLLLSRQAALRQGVAAEDVSQAELERIRRDFLDAVGKLRRELGRGALYQLPWVLITGRAGGGKTEAIRSSRLGKICGDNWRKGIGGTHTLDFFFTDRMIFLDTPGEWVAEEQEKRKEELWGRVIRALRRWRGRFPLDAILVVVPADDLLELPEDELVAQAERIRRVIVRFQEELELRLPVYVIVSKLDLVRGFREFFGRLQPRQQDEMMGWSEPRADRVDPERSARRGMSRLVRHLARERLRMLGAHTLSTRAARNLLLFPREMKRMTEPLAVFLSTLFEREGRAEPTPFRGVYFSSALQQGNPLGRLLEEMAERLGVEVPPSAEPEPRKRRSYFLRDLFYHRIPRDRGLAGHSVVHWFRRRRDTALVGFLPAIIAIVLLGWALLAYNLNTRLYERVSRGVPGVVGQLEEISRQAAPLGDRIHDALPLLERLRRYREELVMPSLARGFGMRRGKRLPEDLLHLQARWFREIVVAPMVDRLNRELHEPGAGGCTRAAARLEAILRLPDVPRPPAAWDWQQDLCDVLGWEVSREDDLARLAYQAWSLRQVPAEIFPVAGLNQAAGAVEGLCRGELDRSPLQRYRTWADACRDVGEERLATCWMRLQQVTGQGIDVGEIRRRVRGLGEALADRAEDLSGLRDGRAFQDLGTAQGSADAACEDQFRALQDRLRQFVEQCGAAIEGRGGDCSREAYLRLEEAWNQEMSPSCSARAPLSPVYDVACGYAELRRLREGDFGVAPPGTTEVRNLEGFRGPIAVAWLKEGCEAARKAWYHLEEESRREDLPWVVRQSLARKARERKQEYCSRFREEWRQTLATLDLLEEGQGNPDRALEGLRDCEKDLVSRLQPWWNAVACASRWCGRIPTAQPSDAQAYCQWITRELLPAYRDCQERPDRCSLAECATETDTCSARADLQRLLLPFAEQLHGPLEAPLRRAAGAVVPAEIARRKWKELRDRFDAIRDKFPLKPAAGGVAEAAVLRDLFGRPYGRVPRLYEMRRILPRRANQWLEQAQRLGGLLFAPGTDEWRAIRFRVDAVRVSTEPAKGASWEPTEVKLVVGDAVTRWRPPEERRARKRGDPWAPAGGGRSEFVMSFDPTVSQVAGVRVTLEYRPHLLGVRMPWRGSKGPEKVDVKPEGASWALPRLLAEACEERGETGLVCDFEKSFDDEKVRVEMDLECPGGNGFLADLQAFLDGRLGPPPAWEGK